VDNLLRLSNHLPVLGLGHCRILVLAATYEPLATILRGLYAPR
jgi:hypothetical protein